MWRDKRNRTVLRRETETRSSSCAAYCGADNSWMMSESTMGLQRMMEELAAEIVSKGMEPNLERKRTCDKKEAGGPMVIEEGGTFVIMPWVKKFDLFGYRHEGNEKCEAGMEHAWNKDELVVQGGVLAPQEGNQFLEEMCKYGEPCLQCGLEHLCELVLAEDRTPHQTQHTRNFSRRVAQCFHMYASSNAPAVAQGLVTHVSM